MDTKRFNDEHAAKSRAVCERIEREDAERRGKLADLMDVQLKGELRHSCDKLRHSCETTMSQQENDAVAHPAHYTQGGIECIDAMRAALTHAEFVGYLRANVLKYIWRYDRKGAPVQDLRKAAWYLRRLIGEVERDEG